MTKIVRQFQSQEEPRVLPLPRFESSPEHGVEAGSPADDAAQVIPAMDRDIVEAARLAAIEEGREQGYTTGLAAAKAEWDAGLDQLSRLVQAVEANSRSDLAALEDKLVELSFEAAARIVGETLVQPEALQRIARNLLNAAADQSASVILRLSPDDHCALQPYEDQLRHCVPAGLSLVSDARIELGGCVLETPRGTLDARLQIQFQRLKEILLEARRGAGRPL